MRFWITIISLKTFFFFFFFLLLQILFLWLNRLLCFFYFFLWFLVSFYLIVFLSKFTSLWWLVLVDWLILEINGRLYYLLLITLKRNLLSWLFGILKDSVFCRRFRHKWWFRMSLHMKAGSCYFHFIRKFKKKKL